MEENVFYTSLDIRSAEPIDKRMYIDALTNQNLILIFGVNGEYGITKAVVFNRDDTKFYYYTGIAPSSDILNPSNWSEFQISSSGKFIQWSNDTSYEVGSTVYDPLTVPTGIKFYIAKQTTTIGLNPFATSDEWFQVGASGSVRQTAQLTIPLVNSVFTANVIYTDIDLPSIPTVNISCKFGTTYKQLLTDYVVNANTHTITLTIDGDIINMGLASGVNCIVTIQ